MKRISIHSRLLGWLIALGVITMACKIVENAAVSPTPEPAAQPSVSPAVETPIVIETLSSPTQPVELPFRVGSSPRFAVFSEEVGEISARVQQEGIAGDLGNVRNGFALSGPQFEHLVKDGFVVSPGTEKEFYALYEKARYANVPIFATSDALLHSYHLLFDKVLRNAEVDRFIPMLQRLNLAMLEKTDEQYRQLTGGAWEDAARRTVAFFGVGTRLLDPQAAIPDYAADLVAQEISLIDAANGIQPSPLFPGLEFGEDYTQYIPRGHYTRSEDLKAYFRSMMWYGRMTFRLKTDNPEVGKAETRTALLQVHALQNATVDGQPAADAWAELYAPTVFFVGRSDDLTAVQYNDVMAHVYGANPGLEQLVDETRLQSFIDLAQQLPPPRILGIVISDTDDETEATKGLRFMGQRFVPDAYIFRQLIYRNVGTPDNRRGLPKGMDLLAAMGSERAYSHLETMGDTTYQNYPQQMDKVRTWLGGLSADEWTETLYNTWLYSFFPLLEVPGEGYPTFMRSQAWQDKQLNATLGSWAELKHDTILYAKQAYAEMGGGPPPPPPLPPRGYVEPVPVFYARLAALTEMTRTGLDQRGLLNDTDRESLQKLEDLAKSFQVMAEKELRGEALSDEENEQIRYYGGALEDFVMRSADTDVSEDSIGNPVFMDEDQQAAVIADVATDPDPGGTGAGGPVVLEVGVGRVNEIHVVVPVVNADGTTSLQVAKGGVFSYYEFPWPAVDRLTDEKWHALIDGGQAPKPQDWMASFLVAEGEYSNLGLGVKNYQDDVTMIYWTPQDAEYYLGAATEWLRPEAANLAAQKQYIGHQLVSTHFRSFDLQSDTTAVVTVREVWQDSLYAYSGDYPNYDETPSGRRGPYSLEVTYTLTFQPGPPGSWTVTNAVYNAQPPGWQ